MGKPVWVRFVLVPGLTDDPDNIAEVARIVAPMTNVEWVEVLPFHQMGEFKWKSLGLEYQLAETPTPTRCAGACRAGDLSQCRLPRALTNRRAGGETSMLSFISDLIGAQPILALFLAIGLGYAVGQINILGFSLGIGAVLFVGLAIGAIAPKAQIAGPIGLIGLIMFLYGIGILYGRQFFEGLTGPGRTYNLLALVAVVAGLLVALGLGAAFGVQIGHTLGIFAGSMTSTRDVAGGARRDGQQGSVDRLFGRLSVRRDRADPVLLLPDAACEAGISAEAGTVPHGGDHHRAAARGRHARWARSSDRCPRACRSPASGRSIAISCPTQDIVVKLGDALLIAATARLPSQRRSPRWAGSNRAASRRTAAIFPISGSSSPRSA